MNLSVGDGRDCEAEKLVFVNRNKKELKEEIARTIALATATNEMSFRNFNAEVIPARFQLRKCPRNYSWNYVVP